MKKTAIAVAALALGAVALAGTSCSKTETHEENVVEISSNYSGTLTCTVRDTDYPSENIKVSVAEGEEDQTIVIKMYKVRFVPQMPVEMTFNIGPIKCSAASDGTVTLSADGTLIPYTDVATYEAYAVTGFSGTATSDSINLSMTFATPMGPAPTKYSGVSVRE